MGFDDSRVHIIHDNPEWIAPFAAALEAARVPFTEILLGDDDAAGYELDVEPPAGVFWSRLSASAPTRGRRGAKEQGRSLLRWLESWDRRTVNGSRVLELEVSKSAQHGALRRAGIDVPRTTVVHGRAAARAAASAFGFPVIVKHNQGGKGLGVRRFDTDTELESWAAEPDDSPDGVLLVQEFLRTRESFITRAEFVGGEFLYAVRVDTSGGAFELCPAEACAVDGGRQLFERRGDIDAEHPLVTRHREFLANEGIAIAGIEFAETDDGRIVTYDVNTNTNYNPDVEASAVVSGASAIAELLGDMLRAATATA